MHRLSLRLFTIKGSFLLAGCMLAPQSLARSISIVQLNKNRVAQLSI